MLRWKHDSQHKRLNQDLTWFFVMWLTVALCTCKTFVLFTFSLDFRFETECFSCTHFSARVGILVSTFFLLGRFLFSLLFIFSKLLTLRMCAYKNRQKEFAMKDERDGDGDGDRQWWGTLKWLSAKANNSNNTYDLWKVQLKNVCYRPGKYKF